MMKAYKAFTGRAKEPGELKKELSDSIRLLSEMLSANQRTAAEAQSSQLRLLETRINTFESVNEQKLDAMRTRSQSA